MKKWIFAAFTAAAIFATTGVSAQKHITKPEMTPELTTEAEAALQSYKATAEEKEQNKVLKQLYKKKEEQDLLIIGYYFLDKGELELAEKTAEKLYDEDAKFVPGLILSGDVQVAKKNWGEAGRKYDEALNYDPEVIEAYIKKAQVYKNVEPQTPRPCRGRMRRRTWRRRIRPCLRTFRPRPWLPSFWATNPWRPRFFSPQKLFRRSRKLFSFPRKSRLFRLRRFLCARRIFAPVRASSREGRSR